MKRGAGLKNYYYSGAGIEQRRSFRFPHFFLKRPKKLFSIGLQGEARIIRVNFKLIFLNLSLAIRASDRM